jgi:O-antigen ligase
MGAIRISRWVTLGALFLAPFVALFLDRSFYFPFVTGREFAFRVIVEIAVAGWLVLAAAAPRYQPRASWILASFALLVAWMAIADALAVDPHKAFWGGYERMDGWLRLVHVFALFVVAACVLEAEGLWTRWWLAFAAASALVCGLGLLQIARLVPAPAWPRVDAGFGNPEFLAAYLLFAIPTTLWLSLDGRGTTTRPWRVGLMSLAALQALVLAASGTRGAYVGLAAGVSLGAMLWLGQGGRARRTAAVLALAAPIALLATLVLVRFAPALARNPLTARLTQAGLGELRIRFALWRMAWDGFLERPITGWGHEGFIHVFYRFYSPFLAGYDPWFDRAHNVYLDWLVAGGAPALLLFLGLLASAAVAIARGRFSPAGRAVLLSALAAYCVQGLAVFDNLLSYAPLAAMLALAHSRRAEAPSRPERTDQPPAPGVVGVAASLAAGGLALVIAVTVLPGLRANLDLNRVLSPPPGEPVRLAYFKLALDARGFAAAEICEKLAQAGVAVAGSDAPDDDKASFIRYAIAQTRAELDRRPRDARLRLALARLYRSVGDLGDARAQIDLALRTAPNHPLLLQERDLERGRPVALAPRRSGGSA